MTVKKKTKKKSRSTSSKALAIQQQFQKLEAAGFDVAFIVMPKGKTIQALKQQSQTKIPKRKLVKARAQSTKHHLVKKRSHSTST